MKEHKFVKFEDYTIDLFSICAYRRINGKSQVYLDGIDTPFESYDDEAHLKEFLAEFKKYTESFDRK